MFKMYTFTVCHTFIGHIIWEDLNTLFIQHLKLMLKFSHSLGSWFCISMQSANTWHSEEEGQGG